MSEDDNDEEVEEPSAKKEKKKKKRSMFIDDAAEEDEVCVARALFTFAYNIIFYYRELTIFLILFCKRIVAK